MKIGAPEIVRNLNFSGPDGLPLIPRGALLYVSTDDPEGLCTGCMAQRKPCSEYKSPKPEGCPEDVSNFLCVSLDLYLLILCIFCWFF